MIPSIAKTAVLKKDRTSAVIQRMKRARNVVWQKAHRFAAKSNRLAIVTTTPVIPMPATMVMEWTKVKRLAALLGPIKDIAEIYHCPILLIHGTNDNIIPCAESEELQRASHGAVLWLVDNAGHNESMLNGLYQERLKEFYERKTGNH